MIHDDFLSLGVMTSLLTAAATIRDLLDHGISVLLMEGHSDVHLKAIISSLIQISMDAQYRTLEGFLALFAKEWLHPRHEFSECSREFADLLLALGLPTRMKDHGSRFSSSCRAAFTCFNIILERLAFQATSFCD